MGKKKKNNSKAKGYDRADIKFGKELRAAFKNRDLDRVKDRITTNNVNSPLVFCLDAINKKFLDVGNGASFFLATPLFWATFFYLDKFIYYFLSQGANLFEKVTLKTRGLMSLKRH